jgi:hypothetical protein
MAHLRSIGWITGYLNILGQVAGVASTEWGLSGMILAAVVMCREDYVIENWHQFLLFTALLIIHGLLKWVDAVSLSPHQLSSRIKSGHDRVHRLMCQLIAHCWSRAPHSRLRIHQHRRESQSIFELVGANADRTIHQSAIIIIITLLATTPRAEMHPGSYIFTEVVNNTGWPSNGLAVALGLLSVQWTMTGESGWTAIHAESAIESFLV